MLLLGFLIIPVVLAAGKSVNVMDHRIEINNDNVLIDVEPTSVSTELDLSRRDLSGIEPNAFQHAVNLTSLNLAHNSIVELPENVFKRLRRLKYISLANNRIATFRSAFAGLRNLETVDLSNNPLVEMSENVFQGNENCDFILKGSMEKVYYFTNTAFYNLTETLRPTTPVTIDIEALCMGLPTFAQIQVEDLPDDNTTLIDENTKCTRLERANLRRLNQPDLVGAVRVEACIQEGTLSRLSVMSESSPSPNCREVAINSRQRSVNLTNLGIRNFDPHWYRLSSLPSLSAIDLSSNDIVNLTESLLNDLPASVQYVKLALNSIASLQPGTIRNQFLIHLNLSQNHLSEIPGGAFDGTQLSSLALTGNRFSDSRFLRNLPSSLTELYLNCNRIADLAPNAFQELRRLIYLHLGANGITRLGRESLRGLTSLQHLDLSLNGLRVVEAGAFDDLGEVRTLGLNSCGLTRLESGFFAGLKSLLFLELLSNNFTRITKDTFKAIPGTVRTLDLTNNGIESLEAGSFVRVPKYSLSLSENKISRIEREYFDIPTLHALYLSLNRVTELKEETLDLPSLRTLRLASNEIRRIERGAFRGLGKVTHLDISDNPFTRLERGSLVGMSRSTFGAIYVVQSSLEVLQGGVFVDE